MSALYIIPDALSSAPHRNKKTIFGYENYSWRKRSNEGDGWEKKGAQVKSFALATEPHLELSNISCEYTAQPLLLEF